MNRFALVRELVKDPSLRVTEIAWKTGYNKGHVSRLRKEAKGDSMIENKSAKTPADSSMAWGCQCGRAYTVTCISSKPQKKEWVGLTAYEIQEIYSGNQHWGNFACAIEAKLKEKNS
jgi:hypothetical protein